MRTKRIKIYKTRKHLFLTVCFILVPFLFLLVFSEFAHIKPSLLFQNFFISFFRLIAAYIIAASLGWLFAVSFYRGKKAAIALPVFDVLQSFPTFAALPTAVFFWGPTNFTVIIFLIITIIWPIFFSVISSLKLIKRDWEEAIEISQIKGISYVKKFILPISIPGLITGSVVGLGEGWEALVATEIIVHIKSGLGNFFQSFSSNPYLTAFGILGLLLIIFSLNKLIWLPLLDLSHLNMEE